MIKVLIIDDHQVVVDGLYVLLNDVPDIEVVGTANNGNGALKLVNDLKPDVILCDIEMPEMDGIELTIRISSDFPDCQVLALTMFDDAQLAKTMMKAGAIGYVLKNADKEELIQGIRSAASGRRFLSQSISDKMLNSFIQGKRASSPNRFNLSDRELQIIQLISEGRSANQIAEELSLSSHTIDSHRKNIYLKLGVHSTTELARFALKNNLVK